LVGLDAGGQEDVPGEQGCALGGAGLATTFGANILGAGIGVTEISQPEIGGE
jgi:hypothetical protein